MKGYDVLVLAKLATWRSRDWTYAELASELDLSASQVFESLERCRACRLADETKREVLRENFFEFLAYGVRYVFPASVGEIAAGIPILTPIRGESGGHRFVWPRPGGRIRGYAIEPLCPAKLFAIEQDTELHELFSLVALLRVSDDRTNRARVIEELRAKLQPPAVTASVAPPLPEPALQKVPDDSAQTHSILDAALQLILRQGFERTTHSEIASAAGLSAQAVRASFPDLTSLWNQATERYAHEAGEHVAHAVILGKNATAEQLRGVLDEFIAYLDRDETLYRLAAWGYVERHLGVNLKEALHAMVDAFGAVLQRLAGTQGDLDRALRGYVMVSLAQYYAILRWSEMGRLKLTFPPKQLLDRYRKVLLRGFFPLLLEPNLGMDDDATLNASEPTSD